MLGTFLSALYKARNGHMHVSQIDKALCSGNLRTLMALSGLKNFEALFSNSVGSTYDIWQEVSNSKSVYSHLFQFGIHTLYSRECGLYNVRHMLLGDSL